MELSSNKDFRNVVLPLLWFEFDLLLVFRGPGVLSHFDLYNRSVSVMRLLSEGTIEEGIHQVAQEKLNLEREISNPEGK